MARLLEGKVAALTGATSGIGRAIAIAFVKHGASVAVNHYPDKKSSAEFEDMRKELGEDAALIAVAGDVRRPEIGQELVERTVTRFGRLDVSSTDGIRELVLDISASFRLPTVSREANVKPGRSSSAMPASANSQISSRWSPNSPSSSQTQLISS